MKKRFNKFAILLSLLALTGCNNVAKTQDSLYSGPIDESGRLCINGFESKDDLRLIRQLISETNRDSRLDVDISHDSRYVKYGKGSLKVDYIAGVHGDLFQRINMTSCLNEKDFSDLKEVSCYIYNANDSVRKANISIYQEEHQVLFTESVVLEPNTWTLCKLELNKIVVQFAYEKFQGFAIGLPNNSVGVTDTYYIDQFAVDFGVELSEEDVYYQGVIDNLVNEISLLPKNVALDDETTINKISNLIDVYSSIPTIYRPLVSNYSSIQDLMKKYINKKGEVDQNKSNAKALNFDTCFGLVQAYEEYTTSELSFSYSKEYHTPLEEGSLAVTASEMASQSNWNSFTIVPAYDWSKFTTITFAVYADTSTDFAFCITWDKFVNSGNRGLQVQKANKWTYYSYPAENFSPNGEQINMCGLDATGISVPLKGTVYFSAFMSRNPTYDYIDEMLALLPDIDDVTLENEESIKEIREYYNGLSNTEKAKVSQQTLDLLSSYEDKILQLREADFLEQLPDLIDKIPVKDSYYEQEFSIIYQAYDAYCSLSEGTKASFDATRKQKLLTAQQKFNNQYPNRGLVLLPTENNIEALPSWSCNMGNLVVGEVTDCGYTWAFDKVNLTDDANLNGAIEVQLSNLKLDGFTKIKFWVKCSIINVNYWVSETIWGNDYIWGSPTGSIQTPANEWAEIIIDVNKIHNNYINFIDVLNADEGRITLTAVEGIK